MKVDQFIRDSLVIVGKGLDITRMLPVAESLPLCKDNGLDLLCS